METLHDMDTQPPAVAEIERAIRRYLAAHPHAVDTERGIGEWWLRDARPRYRAGDVHAAIERLVAAHELEQRTLPDGQRAYAIHPALVVPSSPPIPATGPRPPGRS
ncbi:MAG: hypothetical protein JSR59_05240 [Proteobacteria bacterium]|nr:hypothetical protein [Pseudomonadota bacterium]